MRQLATHSHSQETETFVNFLYAEGIETDVDPQENGDLVVWVLDDDHLPKAKLLWSEFQANPADARFITGAEAGQKKFQKDKKTVSSPRAKVISGRSTFGKGGDEEQVFFTLGITILSFGFFAFLFTSPNGEELQRVFMISEVINGGFLPEVQRGQVWRLFSPVVLHGSFMHLFCNITFFWALGKGIESRVGSVRFGAIVLGTALLSNLGQYALAGPNFLGLSGVVFALVGFAWFIQKRNPWEDLGLHPAAIWIALVWMALGFVFAGSGAMLLGNMANWAHLFGFMSGLLFAFIFQYGLKFFARADS